MRPEDAFGLVLRSQRQERGMSQETLALDSNLDRTFISLLERGLRQPSLRTIIQLARSLGLAPEDLVAATNQILSQAEDAGETP